MIGVVGPGALGHMLSFFIQLSGKMPFQLIGRQGPEKVCADIFWDNTWHSLRANLEPGRCDILLLVVKSYDLISALKSTLPRLNAGGVVVLLGNGYIGPLVQQLQMEWPQVIWRKGIVTRGVRLDGEKRFVLSSEGKVLWGAEGLLHPLEQRLFSDLQSYDFEWTKDACNRRREKWFCNTILNSLTGVYRLPTNGDALRLFSQELEVLAREVLALGKELWPSWNANWDELWPHLLGLIKATASNENSMARDVRLGRRTEAEVLSGCLSIAKDRSVYPLLESFHGRLLGS